MSWNADAKPQSNSMDELLAQMEEFSTVVDGISDNYEQRRGLIGKTQAEEKFDKALIRYMLGDYKKAAPDFFILLETGSLDGYSLKAEAEWYLVDSAFRIGQYTIVEEACYQIIEQGPNHLFFTDAVRILLESYGIRNRQDKFQEAMERFVLSGQVESSDSLNYSIGKALFWQGSNARSKAALMEIEADSTLFFTSQYFLGGVLVSEGNFEEGILSFERAINPDATKPVEKELNDLANLAIARTYYETKDFTKAVSYYEKINIESKYFLDRLYEMAWSFIGMEQWDDAIGVIEVFLVAYPEDKHAIRFQNTLGDLYMKTQQYEKALVTYEEVSQQLIPVQERLDSVMEQEAIVKDLVDAKINGQEVDYGLPEYAEDMLMKEKGLTEASKLLSLSREQSSDVQKAQDYADEIQAVLGNEESGLYMYRKDRHALKNIEVSLLDTVLNGIEEELAILSGSASSSDRTRLEEVASELAQIRKDFEASFALNQTMEEMMKQYVGLIRSTQQEASDILAINQALLKEIRYFPDKYSEVLQTTAAKDKEFIEAALAELSRDLEEDIKRLEEISSEKTKNVIMASFSAGSSQSLIQAQLVELQKVHNALLPFWSKTSANRENKNKIERIWNEARKTEDVIVSIYSVIDDVEVQQKKRIAKALEAQQKDLESFSDQVIALAMRSENLGSESALRSFENLSQHIEDRMLGADLGIVKVYWIRKTDIENEITRLRQEQVTKQKELYSRFELISSKLSSE